MSEERFVVGSNEIGEIIVTDVETDRVYRYGDISKFFGLIRLLNEQQATIQSLKERLYDFEKRKIIEESEIDEDVIPKVKMLRTELFGERYE